jgi:hypothetical protein
MNVRRLILAAAVAASGTVGLLGATTPASACTPPNCPGFGGCHVNPDWVKDPTSTTRVIVCNY